jgi:hypothetical protein
MSYTNRPRAHDLQSWGVAMKSGVRAEMDSDTSGTMCKMPSPPTHMLLILDLYEVGEYSLPKSHPSIYVITSPEKRVDEECKYVGREAKETTETLCMVSYKWRWTFVDEIEDRDMWILQRGGRTASYGDIHAWGYGARGHGAPVISDVEEGTQLGHEVVLDLLVESAACEVHAIHFRGRACCHGSRDDLAVDEEAQLERDVKEGAR